MNESDWAADDDVVVNHAISLAAKGPSQIVGMQSEEQSLLLGSDLFGSGNGSLPTLEEAPSSHALTSMVVTDKTNDETVHILTSFANEDTLLLNGNGFDQLTFCKVHMSCTRFCKPFCEHQSMCLQIF